MAFPLVQFMKTSEVAVVPISWLYEEKCYWPPKKLASRILPHVNKGISPSETWPMYPVQILDIYENYDDARRRLRTAEFTSDLNTTDPEDCGRGKRQKKMKRVSSSSSEEEASRLQDMPTYVAYRQPLVVNLVPNLESQEVVSENFDDEGFEQSESLLGNCQQVSVLGNFSKDLPQYTPTPYADTSTQTNEHDESLSTSVFFPDKKRQIYSKGAEQIILKEINIIKANQRSLQDSIDTIIKMLTTRERKEPLQPSSESKLTKILRLLPLKGEEDLKKVEEELMDQNCFDQMVQFLKKMGGNTHFLFIRSILKKFFTDDYAVAFSFLGKRGKTCFKTLNLHKAISCAVRTHDTWKDVTEADWEKVVSNWLRHANSRSSKKVSTLPEVV